MVESTELEELDPWSLYIYAMKAPMTRDRYQTRLAKFLDFIGILQGGTTLEGRASKAEFIPGEYGSMYVYRKDFSPRPKEDLEKLEQEISKLS